MHLPQSLSRMPESFPVGSLQVCSLFLGREPHMGFPGGTSSETWCPGCCSAGRLCSAHFCVPVFEEVIAEAIPTMVGGSYGTLSIPIWSPRPCRCRRRPSSWARHIQRMRSFCARSAAAVQRLDTWSSPCRWPFPGFFNVKGGERSQFTRGTGKIILGQATLVIVEDYA